MILTLERHGLIKRTPGRARSIEVLVSLNGLRRLVASVRQIAGVRRIYVLSSIVTTKPDPKDIDLTAFRTRAQFVDAPELLSEQRYAEPGYEFRATIRASSIAIEMPR